MRTFWVLTLSEKNYLAIHGILWCISSVYVILFWTVFVLVVGACTLKGTMHGSNAGIMSVQFDPQVGLKFKSCIYCPFCMLLVRCIASLNAGVNMFVSYQVLKSETTCPGTCSP